MIQYDRRAQFLAFGLAMLAGFVDALGFLRLGGMFVSFMSGNSTRMAVETVAGDSAARVAFLLIVSFVSGVFLGTLYSARLKSGRRSSLLMIVAGVLAVAAWIEPKALVVHTACLMAFAMGTANTVFQRGGEVSIGVTYMTGALVKFGQRLAMAILGHEPFAWAPYLLLWGSLVSGAMLGALAYGRIGLEGLWIASIATFGLALYARRLTI